MDERLIGLPIHTRIESTYVAGDRFMQNNPDWYQECYRDRGSRILTVQPDNRFKYGGEHYGIKGKYVYFDERKWMKKHGY